MSIFSDKGSSTNFSKIIVKNNFWEAWPFLRERGVGWQKNEYNLFHEEWGTEYCQKKKKKKAHWMKAKKPVLMAHFPPFISGSTGPIISKNNKVH